jgi:hypothetical protein
MGLSYHFSFSAPAKTKPADLETFLKTVEGEAKKLGFNPTLVLNATFDTPERKEFARRLVTGFPIEDERLKGVALPSPGKLWGHDPQYGTARVIPSRCVMLVVTDEHHCETIFGFFKYPEKITDLNGKIVAEIRLKNRWVSRDFVDSPDPRFRTIVRLFEEAHYLEFEKDDFASQS